MRSSLRTLATIVAVAGAVAMPMAILQGVPSRLPSHISSSAGETDSSPRLPDGSVNLGPLPGEPGVWELQYIENMANTVVANPGRESGGRLAGRRGSAAEPQVPFMPWSAAVYDYNVSTKAKYDPESYCLPPGGPRLFTAPYPMEIVQIPNQKRIFFIFEVSHAWREVYLDGRRHPPPTDETWFGHSTGRYSDDGKDLTIDSVNFNEGTWLDFAGHPHTNLLHVNETFTRPNRNQLHYEAVIDDPGAYTRPWTVAWDFKWWPNGKLDEYVCEENNKYIRTLRDDFGVPMFFDQ